MNTRFTACATSVARLWGDDEGAAVYDAECLKHGEEKPVARRS
jgi:hypothetical protein